MKSEPIDGLHLPEVWGSWDVRSLFTQVHLETGFAIELGLKEYQDGQMRSQWLVGRMEPNAEKVWLETRGLLGGDWSAKLEWRSVGVRVRRTATEHGWAVLVEPASVPKGGATLYLRASLLWGRPGKIGHDGQKLFFEDGERLLSVFAAGARSADPYAGFEGPSLAFDLREPVFFTDSPILLESYQSGALAFTGTEASRQHDLTQELSQAVSTCLAWNTVYDPKKDRLIIPVSRRWCLDNGGYVIFCWDTFLAAWMAIQENPQLAAHWIAGALEEATPEGFVPNYSYATGQKSLDRSQPPLGSLVLAQLVKSTGRADLAEPFFDKLAKWNDWWHEKRSWGNVLSWGSNAFKPRFGNRWETLGVGERFGAALESGLDNSPLYDDSPFDAVAGRLEDADAGLTASYLLDLQALLWLAKRLGRREQQTLLQERHRHYLAGLETLWCDECGAYLNRNVRTGEFVRRMAPTNFYPLLVDGADERRLKTTLARHLLNPKRFWGELVLPSISRDDPAYPDQDYWRGRIWAPLNFLVYLGLRRHDRAAASVLAQRSAEIFLKEWREERHVHENYNAETGDGDDVVSSDAFYHWGALMAMARLIDQGWADSPWTDGDTQET